MKTNVVFIRGNTAYPTRTVMAMESGSPPSLTLGLSGVSYPFVMRSVIQVRQGVVGDEHVSLRGVGKFCE